MKTIHIQYLKRSKNKKLIKELYKQFLFKDELFHFFYEPELIIRVSNKKILENIEKYLANNLILYKIYDYPKPVKTEGNYCFECDTWVLKNIKYFIQLYHIHSVLYFKLSKNKYASYIHKVSHTARNIANWSYYEEARDQIMTGLMYHQLAFKK